MHDDAPWNRDIENRSGSDLGPVDEAERRHLIVTLAAGMIAQRPSYQTTENCLLIAAMRVDDAFFPGFDPAANTAICRPLVWTHIIPSMPGWYWVRSSQIDDESLPDHDPSIVEFSRSADDGTLQFRPSIDRFPWSKVIPATAAGYGIEWAGPVEFPVEPESGG